MGYFANGSEGQDYEETFCVRCVHGADPLGCEVWNLHQQYNYDECNKPASFLHDLIPRTKDGLGNGTCRMFHAKKETR